MQTPAFFHRSTPLCTQRLASLGVAFLLGLGGCAESSAPTMDGPVSGEGHALVGPAGGRVTAGAATVQIPAGALTSFVDIGIAPMDVLPTLPDGLVVAGTAFALTPHGTQFSVPISIELPASAETTTVLRLDNPSDTTWDALQGAQIDEFNRARVTVTGFSVYVTARPDDEFYIPVDAGTDASTIDAGHDTGLPDAALDAGAPDTGVDANVPTACGSITAESLQVVGAGSGSVSGCAPRTCTGLYVLATTDTSAAEQLDSQLDGYVGCTTIEGDLLVNAISAGSVPQLSCLEHVTGSVVIWNSPGLTTLAGLESLLQVDGDFNIGFFGNLSITNDALTRVDALSNLRVIGGTLHIDGGYELNSLAGLEQLRFVGANFTVSFPRQAHDLSGMNALEIIGGSLDLWRPEGLETITGLRSLREIGGMFLLWGATDMVEFPGLPNVECIGAQVDIGGDQSWEVNAQLKVVHAFPKLTRIDGEILLEDNASLERFDLLSTVERVAALHVNRNAVLSSMPLSPALRVDGMIEITHTMLLECALDDLVTSQSPSWPGTATFSDNAMCL